MENHVFSLNSGNNVTKLVNLLNSSQHASVEGEDGNIQIGKDLNVNCTETLMLRRKNVEGATEFPILLNVTLLVRDGVIGVYMNTSNDPNFDYSQVPPQELSSMILEVPVSKALDIANLRADVEQIHVNLVEAYRNSSSSYYARSFTDVFFNRREQILQRIRARGFEVNLFQEDEMGFDDDLPDTLTPVESDPGVEFEDLEI